jgi:hypothetical protein
MAIYGYDFSSFDGFLTTMAIRQDFSSPNPSWEALIHVSKSTLLENKVSPCL